MKQSLLTLGVLSYLLLFFPVWAFSDGNTKANHSIVLEDFSVKNENGLPPGWKPQHKHSVPSEAYEIFAEGKESYLHSNGKPIRIFKKMKWNPNEYPYLTWKWRMLKVPNDPDKERNATIYIALDTDLLGIPKLTKYAWSSNKTVGTEESGGMFRPITIILRSGAPKSGEWVTETINVLEEYQRLHGGTPPDESYGFGILSTLEAEFGAFIAHK